MFIRNLLLLLQQPAQAFQPEDPAEKMPTLSADLSHCLPWTRLRILLLNNSSVMLKVFRVLDSLLIPFKEVLEPTLKLIDVLQSLTADRIALPVNKAIIDPAKILWQTPSKQLPHL